MRTTRPILDRSFLAGLGISTVLHGTALLALSFCVLVSPARTPPARSGEHSIRIALLPEARSFATEDPVADEAAERRQGESAGAPGEDEVAPVSTARDASPEIVGPPPPPEPIAPPELIAMAPRPSIRTDDVSKALRPENASFTEPTEVAELDPSAGEDSPPPGLPEGASLLAEFLPHYPRRCRRLGHEGTVSLEVEVSASGRVSSVSVVSSSGCEELDASAVSAVRTARFRPATLAGRPVRSTVVVPVAFRLK